MKKENKLTDLILKKLGYGKDDFTYEQYENLLLLCSHIKQIKKSPYKIIEKYFHSFILGDLLNTDVIDRFNKIQLIKGNATEDRMILTYGNILGKSKWEEYKERQKYTNSLEYKSKKYGMTEDEFIKYNKSRSITIDNMIKKYGVDEGNKKYNDYVEKQKQTKSKEYFIANYGEEYWEILCKSKAHNIENYILRYGDEDVAKSKLEEFYSGLNCVGNVSKIANEFCQHVDTFLKPLKSYNANKGKEFAKYDKINNRVYLYDYVSDDHKLCIEFHGDYYHANPIKYRPNDYISVAGKYAKDIWEYDKIKKELIESFGYDCIIIWESDYRQNSDDVIEGILNYVKNRNK